jgi:hypothetical protein
MVDGVRMIGGPDEGKWPLFKASSHTAKALAETSATC